MKNIHVLPTDKPSRLIGNNLGFILSENNDISKYLHLIEAKYYNIYITSDEEIKDGYVLNIVNNTVYKIVPDNSSREILANPTILPLCSLLPEHYVKIILTTDQDLIKDGVQAIDDALLEWFVKNPSCDKVGLEKLEGRYVDYSENVHSPIIYKIIIPKEGTKQDSLEEAAKRWIRQPKLITNKESFIAGAKCYKEISYSEEEVRELLETQRGNCYVALLHHTKNDDIASVALNAPEPGGKNGTWVKKIKKK